MPKKLTEDDFLDAFRTISRAARLIGCSRPTIYSWISQGRIPEICGRGNEAANNWHDRIRKLGYNPRTLRKM